MTMVNAKERLTEGELALLTFWDACRKGRPMPERTDFTPEDLFPWMGYLHLLKPIDDGADFQYMVFTTRTLLGQDQDMSRKRVSEWPDKRADFARQLYRTVMTHRHPVYSLIPERFERDMVLYSRVCLPLGKDGRITHIMSHLTPQDDADVDPIFPTVISF